MMIRLFIYRLLIILLLPIALIRLWVKSFKEPHYRQRLLERFGILSIKNTSDKPLIWLHCVSVGEFLATKPLIEKILATNQYQLLITSTTPTGSAQIQQHYSRQVLHTYLPFDVSWFYQGIITKLNPTICLLTETEIWANLIITLKKHHIPSVLMNARLSAKSFKSYQKFAQFSKLIMRKISLIATQNKQTYDYFLQLGVRSEQIINVGNIKFDLNLTLDPEQTVAIKTLVNYRPIILFASTHKGEEALILEAYLPLKAKFDNALIVIAPRHPTRSKEIISLIEKYQLSYQKRTDSKVCPDNVNILLLDTLGELLSFYRLSTLCFIGGSLVDKGGHNMLEPAGFKKPILFGKHTQNFPQVTRDLLDNQGAIEVKDAQDLLRQLLIFYKDKDKCQKLGHHAYQYFSQNQGATDRIMNIIQSFLSNS